MLLNIFKYRRLTLWTLALPPNKIQCFVRSQKIDFKLYLFNFEYSEYIDQI